jgi:hypothetical protein
MRSSNQAFDTIEIERIADKVMEVIERRLTIAAESRGLPAPLR